MNAKLTGCYQNRKIFIIADSKWVDSTHAGNIRADKGFKAIQLIQ